MESDTTIRVYTTDRDWLQRRQRRIGAAGEKWPTMADVIRELIAFVKAQEDAS